MKSIGEQSCLLGLRSFSGVMEDIKKIKRAAEENTNADVLTDILDGE